MLKRFFPQQPDFFKSLSEIADLSVKAAEYFEDMAKSPTTFEKNTMAISEIEKHADTLVRHAVAVLSKTFITPIEREHLHSLYLLSDEVIDLIYASSERFIVYKLTDTTPLTQEMIRLTKECVILFQRMVHNLEEMDNPEQLQKIALDIHRVENEIDAKMRQSLSELYDSDLGVSRILKERDVILVIERISDEIEKIAHLIEAILLDQA